MAVGAAVTSQILADRMGSICNNIDRSLAAFQATKKWLDARTGEQVESELGLQAGEGAVYKSAATELAGVAADWGALTFVFRMTGIGAQPIVNL